jgi:Putative zinc binding domain/C-methyltransferase C-terminal domain/Methyltransferase domain
MNNICSEVKMCEVCGEENLFSVLDLGRHPMCDDLVPIGDNRICNEYPIEILFCRKCNTAHQRFQVPKQDLFPSSYHYRSRFTADVLNGMAGLVDSCEEEFGSLAGKKVLDIGCNDGSLLDFFKSKNAVTLGIEPTDACLDARDKGHTVYQEFLSEKVADSIIAIHEKPDFITFTNVFAHIENLQEVILSLKKLCSNHTKIIIENHYLGSVLAGNQFDTFYHEHPRTYSCTSFIHIAHSLEMKLIKVEFPYRYGGNIRVFMGMSEAIVDDGKYKDLREQEKIFFEQFIGLNSNIQRWKQRKKQQLLTLVKQYGKLRAKAFPGRAAILVRMLDLNEDLVSTVYEKPGSLKIGHYLPGSRLPISSDDELFKLTDKTVPLLNLAWHIPGEIRTYLDGHYPGPVIDILNKQDFLLPENN